MSMKRITSNKVDVVKLYRKISRALLAEGLDKINIDALRAELVKNGFSDKNKKGETYKDGGLRLQINKSLLVIKDSGLKDGVWSNEKEYEVWKKSKFVRIVAPVYINDVKSLVDDLD